MDFPIKTIAQLQPILQGFRKATGLSQAAVAKKLGITQQSYAEFELNPQLASTERVYKILRLFNVEISLSHKADPESELAAETKLKTTSLTKPTKKPSKPNEPNSKLVQSELSKSALERAKKESW